MHNATAITTDSANQRPNYQCIRLWIYVTFRGVENSYSLERKPLNLFIRPTCRDVLWYGAGVCLSVRLSTKLVDTIQTEPYKLGPSNLVHLLLMTRRRLLRTYYGMALASVCLSVRLSTKHVDTIHTEPFMLGPSNLVHLLLMTRRRTLLIVKVRGQRSRSP